MRGVREYGLGKVLTRTSTFPFWLSVNLAVAGCFRLQALAMLRGELFNKLIYNTNNNSQIVVVPFFYTVKRERHGHEGYHC